MQNSGCLLSSVLPDASLDFGHASTRGACSVSRAARGPWPRTRRSARPINRRTPGPAASSTRLSNTGGRARDFVVAPRRWASRPSGSRTTTRSRARTLYCIMVERASAGRATTSEMMEGAGGGSPPTPSRRRSRPSARRATTRASRASSNLCKYLINGGWCSPGPVLVPAM